MIKPSKMPSLTLRTKIPSINPMITANRNATSPLRILGFLSTQKAFLRFKAIRLASNR
jgi:hypothetical protein